jgi:hypothetical protein
MLGLGNTLVNNKFRNSFTGILNKLSVPSAAAYSLRKLDNNYTGWAIRVRRSSDNAETNIGFVNNVLDTATLLSFVGAGDGFVTTWYDQSGNGRNATQTTAGRQPNIVNAGVVLPAPDFDGVDDDMRSTVGAIGSNCEIMVATNDGVYFQDGCRFTDVASHLRLPHSGNLRSYVVLDTSFTAAEKSQIATYFGFADYTDAQWILSTRTVTNPKLRIDTTGSVTWNAVWSGGSATGLATGAERTLTMAGYRGLIVITTTGGAAITRSDSGTNLWANTLSDLPSGLTYYADYGNNTVSGSLADLPSGLTYYGHYGSNTVSGSLADLPSGLTLYAHTGFNTVSGSLADLPAGLTFYNHSGNNTVSGSLADLPSGLTLYAHTGFNTVTFSGTTWHRTTMDTVRLGNNKDSATVDAILNALAASVTSWIGGKRVDLQEPGNAAPTAASATARTTIAGLGATVLVN